MLSGKCWDDLETLLKNKILQETKRRLSLAEWSNRPFYSCVRSYRAVSQIQNKIPRPMTASEAGVDLALIQTFLLLVMQTPLVSIRTT